MILEDNILIKLLKMNVEEEYIRKFGKTLAEDVPKKSDIDKLIEHSLEKNKKEYSKDRKEFLRFRIIRSIGRTKAEDQPNVIDSHDYEPWLNDNAIPLNENRKINWNFSDDYKNYLIDNKGWSENFYLRSIDRETTQILNRLMDPKFKGRWIRKGMVVGNVQSGKTGNYTGLIAKSIDAGYKIIIVLAGLHNSLRLQTQQRLDKEFIGFDTSRDDNTNKINRIGVGLKSNHFQNKAIVYWNTYADPAKGDFTIDNAFTGIQINSSMPPLVFIVKKNKYILENVINWLKQRGLEENQDKIENIPLLLIDDECDNASINTKPYKDNKGRTNTPTAINRCIRELLHLFDQTAYVGYTATPYANMLIPRDNKVKEEIALDLFPSNFIIHLDAPKNYIGPKHIFGLEKIKELDQDEYMGFPLVRTEDVDTDYYNFIPDKHKSDFIITQNLPESLINAILSFILSCAARLERNQYKQHSSMLIHVTRFVKVQEQVFNLVDEYLIMLRSKVRNGDEEIFDILENLWNDDFVFVSNQMAKIGHGQVNSFKQIKRHLVDVLDDIGIPLKINGEAGDVLEYEQASKQNRRLTVIAIGGDKLSRGLTLEGLTVSYYLRSTRMYDTLLQMGRWFGYKDGYQDLCRIFTTGQLARWYSHIASVNIELEEEFKSMVADKLEPKNYGMKIRSHSGLMEVTSLSKRRSGIRQKISFSGRLAKPTYIPLEEEISIKNAKLIDNLFVDHFPEKIYRLNKGNKSSLVGQGIRGYRGINNFELVINFINNIGSMQKSFDRTVANYIDLMVRNHNELTDWTILVVSPPGNKDKQIDLGLQNITHVFPVVRSEAKEKTAKLNTSVNWSGGYLHCPKSFTSASDLVCDLTREEMYKINYNVYHSRRTRSADKGLLCIYPIIGKDRNDKSYTGKYPIFAYAVDFPESMKAEKLEYIIDEIMAKEFED